jgi:hypothetical protein
MESGHRSFIGQGANDSRVKQSEAEQIVAAIQKNGGTAIYVLYPDEGRVFTRPANRMDFLARTERFALGEPGRTVRANGRRADPGLLCNRKGDRSSKGGCLSAPCWSAPLSKGPIRIKRDTTIAIEAYLYGTL